MKRLIFILTICFSLVSLSSFANETKVGDPVLESFNNSFKQATDINWTMINEDYYKVSFSLNDQYITAYYDQEGHMLAMTRNISSNQLPIALQVGLKNNYSQYWITDLFEINNEQGTAYYVTLENANAKMVMKSSIESTWVTYKKVNK